LAQAKRAHELDSLSSVISSNLAFVHLVRGDAKACIEESRKVIDLDPNFRGGHVFLGLAYLKEQRYPEAIAALEKAVELSGRASVEMQRLGYGYAVSGQRLKALSVIKELEQRFVRQEARGYDIAAVHAGLGEKDRAFEWVEKDLQNHSGKLAGIKWDPPFESLRTDARFQKLVRAMGLEP
jgi:serine/threonine-protein kinase